MTDLVAAPTINALNSTFTVGDITYESQLEEDLFVNRGDLSAEFARHAERFAFYATAYELAVERLQRLENALKRLYAQLDHEKRGALMSAGVKTTEKMIENSVITDERYIAGEAEVLEGQKQVGVLKAARDAMIHRRDMLVSLGATYRAEVRADVSMMSDQVRGRG